MENYRVTITFERYNSTIQEWIEEEIFIQFKAMTLTEAVLHGAAKAFSMCCGVNNYRCKSVSAVELTPA